jgi:predicted ferric reductase
VLLVAGFATPIFFTLLGFLPYMTGLFERIKPYIVYPSTIATYHVRPLPYLLGNPPTVRQSLYVVMFFILNIILTSVNYRSTQPNAYFASTYQEIMAYVSCRTGVLAFAIAPLVILFSGRNNILLWLTNWSHSTYMLLHRWVARIFAVQVILHSIVELVLYIDMGEFDTEAKQPYWIWGVVATLATCIMLVASLLYVRLWSYEVFLVTHIVLAIFVLVGSWYHVELLFTRKWGYELWLYTVFAVWFFDRILRVFRVAKNGIRRATVTEISGDIVRVDVKGVRWAAQPGMHTYAYFPSLNPLKPWENHPFSVIPTILLKSNKENGFIPSDDPRRASSENHDVEKAPVVSTVSDPVTRCATTAGVSFYIRKSTGGTKYLKSCHKLVTLLDGPYFNNPTHAVLKCDRLVLVAGGIGITGLLPFLACHANVKLYWSVRKECESLVKDLDPILAGAVKEVRIGRRLEVKTLLEDEGAGGWAKIGVVACGPGGLCDDVRAIVASKGRGSKTVWELEVDAFSW